MTKTANLLIVCSALFCCRITALAQSQDDSKAMMDYMTPGPVHQMMAKSAGTWTGVVTYWMQPGANPTTAPAEATNQMILGGRYLQTRNTGNMMGMPFEGIGVTGYDNAKKIFVSSWVDNMGTGILYMEGTMDDQHKSITYTGKAVDPVTKVDQPFRQVLKFIDDNTQELEMYMTVKGQEYKAMDIKYTRK